MKPPAVSSQLGFDHPDDDFVGNQLAALHVAFALLARVRCLACGARAAMSPVEICAIAEALLQNLRLRAFAGARAARGRSTSHLSLDEPAVVAHRQARFDLRDRVERHADDDEQRGRAEIERRDREAALQRARQHGEQAEVDRGGGRDAQQNLVDVVDRRLARTDARNERAASSSGCPRCLAC